MNEDWTSKEVRVVEAIDLQSKDLLNQQAIVSFDHGEYVDLLFKYLSLVQGELLVRFVSKKALKIIENVESEFL